MHNKVRVGVSAVIINENKEILVTKRSLGDDFLPGFWDIPGGGIDPEEELEAALKREILEECGIEIQVIKKIGFNTYMENDIEAEETTFLVKAITTNIILNPEHTEFKWLKYADLNKVELSDYVKNLIEPAKKNLLLV